MKIDVKRATLFAVFSVFCVAAILAYKWIVISYNSDSYYDIDIEMIKGLRYEDAIDLLGSPIMVKYHYIQINNDASKNKPVNYCEFGDGLSVNFDANGEMVSIFKNGVNVWQR